MCLGEKWSREYLWKVGRVWIYFEGKVNRICFWLGKGEELRMSALVLVGVIGRIELFNIGLGKFVISRVLGEWRLWVFFGICLIYGFN